MTNKDTSKKVAKKAMGIIARDKALEKVTQNNSDWIYEAIAFVETKIPYGWTGTGEDIRFLLNKAGFKRPHHHNSYGCMVMHCVRTKKLLKKTGKYRAMIDRSSHGRSTPEYKKIM